MTTTAERIDAAVRAIGPGELTASIVDRHVAPLFARHKLAYGERVYLANHSLGRPLDATDDDMREGLERWYVDMGAAWDPWADEMAAHRDRLARLIGAPNGDCVVPKTSAGQGLRAVLNALDGTPRVVATRGEFDSLDVILREYARRGRIRLSLVEPREDERFDTRDIVDAIGAGADLVVVSEVMFNTGQRLTELPAIVAAAHAAGAKILVDVYHATGVIESDVSALDADFAVGGSYKYLRGGPGACFLYIHPRHLDGSLRTLDIGWFAKEARFAYRRPDPPRFAEGGDGWLESTPPVLTYYQARAGQLFTLALGIARIRSYSLACQRSLVAALASEGVKARGGTEDRGAFVVVTHPRAVEFADALRAQGIVTDARGPHLRFCPDILTTDDELERASNALARLMR
ncbi:MAG TPA: aminotransferase class V-fold PLP-dependent enzyme [Casimicrobiaceae bacterium]|nr:aminotransferase class V-fold PLP-dependent enzyme [Casimicrobiaceae bacterium]